MDNTHNSTCAKTSGGEGSVADTSESQVGVLNNRDNSDGTYLQRVMTNVIRYYANDRIHGRRFLETEDEGTTPVREEELEQTQTDLTAVEERLRQDATTPVSLHGWPSSRTRGRPIVVRVTEVSSNTSDSVESNSFSHLTPAPATQTSGCEITPGALEIEEQISNSAAEPCTPWPRYEWFPPCLFNDPTTTFDVFKAFDSSILVGAWQSAKPLDPNETQPETVVEDMFRLGESGIDATSAFHLEPSLTQHIFALFQQTSTEEYNRLAEIWSVQPEGIITEQEVFDSSAVLFADNMTNSPPSSLQEYPEEHLGEKNNTDQAMTNEEFEAELEARGWESPGDGNTRSLTDDLEELSADAQPALSQTSQTSQEHSAEIQGELIEGGAAQSPSLQLEDMWVPEPIPYIQSMSLAQIAAIPTDHITRPDPEHIRRTILHYEQNVFFPMPAQSDYSSRQYYMTAEYHRSIRDQAVGRSSYSSIARNSNRVMTGNSTAQLGEQSPCENRRRGQGFNCRGRARGRGRGGRGRGY